MKIKIIIFNIFCVCVQLIGSENNQHGEAKKAQVSINLDMSGRVQEVKIINSSGDDKVDKRLVSQIKKVEFNKELWNTEVIIDVEEE